MLIRIISIGKIRMEYVKLGEAEYLKRLKSSSWRIETIELDAETVSANQTPVAQKKEAERLLGKIREHDFLVVLDERGGRLSSTGLADWLRDKTESGCKSLVFAIGGAFGWHGDVYGRANLRLSLSELTFPYQLTRLILVEQLYRAHTIIAGSPYHKA